MVVPDREVLQAGLMILVLVYHRRYGLQGNHYHQNVQYQFLADHWVDTPALEFDSLKTQ